MCTPSLDHFHFLIWKDYENCTDNSQEQNPPMKKTCCLTPKSCRQQFNWPCACCALPGLGIRKELSVGGATHRNRVNAFWLFFPLFFSFLLSFPFLPPFLPAYLQFFSLSLFSAKKIRKRDSWFRDGKAIKKKVTCSPLLLFTFVVVHCQECTPYYLVALSFLL